MFKRSIAVLAALSALMLATGWLTLAQEEAAGKDTAQQTITIDVEAMGGLTRDGYVSKLTVGSLVADGVHLSASGSMNQEGFGGGSTTLKLDMSMFSLESKASFNEQGGFTGAEFKGQAPITEQIQMSGKGAVSDTEFLNGVLSFSEAMSGFGLMLDTMWSDEGLDNAALSGKKTLDLYTISAKASDLLGETPTLNAAIQTLIEPVAYSWNGTITMDGLQEQTLGASGALEQVALSGSVTLDGAGNVSLMTAGAKLSQEGLTLDGNVGFTFEGYQNATVKFQYGSEAPSGGRLLADQPTLVIAAPSGETLAFATRDGSAYVTPLSGPPLQVMRGVSPHALAFDERGARLLATTQTQVLTAPLDGSGAAAPTVISGVGFVFALSVAPRSGRALLTLATAATAVTNLITRRSRHPLAR